MPESIDSDEAAIRYPTARNDGWVQESPTANGALSGGESQDGLLRLATFASGDAIKATRRLQGRKALTETTWDAPRAVEFILDVSPLPENDADPEPPKTLNETVTYLTTGDPAGENAGFGFKIEDTGSGAILHGVIHDGSSETVVDLPQAARAVPDRGPLRLRAHTWGKAGAGGPVRFERDGVQVAQAYSGVPSGDGGAAHEILWSASLENQTSGDETRLIDVDASVLQQEA